MIFVEIIVDYSIDYRLYIIDVKIPVSCFQSWRHFDHCSDQVPWQLRVVTGIPMNSHRAQPGHPQDCRVNGDCPATAPAAESVSPYNADHPTIRG